MRPMCQCPECHPEHFNLPATRLGENHIAVRFNHYGVGFNHRVMLDGVDVTERYKEAVIGDAGWAVLYSNHGNSRLTHPCTCGLDSCQELKRGKAELLPRKGC